MSVTLKQLLSNLKEPVSLETREILRSARNKLKEEFTAGIQHIGFQYAGCGATIGVKPRCDFACRGCYLNDTANTTPALAIDDVKKQLRSLRQWLGEGGNTQITDGEVTLLPTEYLIEIICYAREIGLVPMLMTHGDSFIKSPGLLNRLILEGGLNEVSIHIDTTQRGRKQRHFKYAKFEQELTPLRNAFADIIRTARQETGQPLEAATTVTVTQDNIEQIPQIINWILNNADAFKMISFQPLAKVGRTADELVGISTTETLWRQIAKGLNIEFDTNKPVAQQLNKFGHPDCSNFMQGLIVLESGKPAIFHPVFRHDDSRAIDFLEQYGHEFGGVSFRLGSRWEKIFRSLGLFIKSPGFIIGSLIPFAWRNFARLHERGPLHLIQLILRGKARINYLNIVSHHFMSRQEIETPLGQERLDSCIFKVPINDQLVSMCEVNAMGIREQFYASIQPSQSIRLDTEKLSV
ncbi:MAG: hypothetical protein K0U68_07405 [Gammaproteobacteria bacterium]|nr:hypothetical protein [Gammaproteobacteria bacterium]